MKRGKYFDQSDGFSGAWIPLWIGAFVATAVGEFSLALFPTLIVLGIVWMSGCTGVEPGEGIGLEGTGFVGCATDNDCDGATPFCLTEVSVCVECLDSDDCDGREPFCWPTDEGLMECGF